MAKAETTTTGKPADKLAAIKSANRDTGGPAQFVKEAWAELKKVHAPSREETIKLSLLVLAMVAIFSVFLGLTDLVIGKAVTCLFERCWTN